MHLRTLGATLAFVALVTTACDDTTQEQSPGDVLTRDTALANDLHQIDTSSFAEAADVALPLEPDSALRPSATTRPRLRPKPATIHPEPLPRRTLPASGTRRAGVTPNGSAASAASILERIPGATIPAPHPR